MELWALIVDSIRESLDRKIFWVMVIITLVIAAAMACVSFEPDRISLFFGMWEFENEKLDPLAGVGRSRLIGIVIYLIMDMFLGWIGIILMIIATAGMFPEMMQPGAIDVLLAKPMGRSRLFVYKYLATMVFALLQAGFFVGLTFMVMGLRWHVWAPGYLLSIPLLVLLFSYVYCVSVLVAVKTKSTVAAILLSLGAWVLYALPPGAVQTFESFPSLQKHERLYQAARVVAWIPPKTAHVPYIAARWAQAGTSVEILSEAAVSSGANQEELERAKAIEEKELRKSPWFSIGSSLLFEALIVVWAMWLFSRRDY